MGDTTAGIDDGAWKRLQTALYPERITITLCDCALDLLDLQVEYSENFNAETTPEFNALRTSNGFLPQASIIAIGSLVVCLLVF